MDNKDSLKGDEKTEEKNVPGRLKKKFLAGIMFAFGDVSNPNPESVELLEDLVLEFIENLLIKAYKRALRKDPHAKKIVKEDLLYFLADDIKKFTRIAKVLHLEQWRDFIIKQTKGNYIGSDEDSP